MKRLLFKLAAAFCLVSGCATVDDECERQMSDCLKRCDKSGGEEVKVEHVVPEQSQTWCEQRCQHCRETTPPSSAPSSSPPTYTGQ